MIKSGRKCHAAAKINLGKVEINKMSHIDKLEAIKDKIRLDLSDSEIKKEHYHLLSSSLCKPDKNDRSPNIALGKTLPINKSSNRNRNKGVGQKAKTTMP